MDKVVEVVGDDDDFKSAAWVSATNYVNTFGGTVTGCLGDVNNFLKNRKLELVVRIVKSCPSNMLGDLNVTMQDLSGTIPGTIHHKVIGKGGYGKDITVGAAIILTNISVFSSNPSKPYLNITMRNVVEVFRKDTVLGNGSAWVSATNYVNTFGGTVTGCLGDVNNFLKKGKLELVVGIVKSCSPNMFGNLNVTMKDLSGTIPGTIYHKVIGKGGYGKDITVGAAMILTNVSVFSPNPSKHYLNITMRNVVEVFRKDTVLGNGSS
nr:GPCR kinase [Tanacetum cinerariifolium]